MREGKPRGSKRRYDTILGFASAGRDRDLVTGGIEVVALPGDSEGWA